MKFQLKVAAFGISALVIYVYVYVYLYQDGVPEKVKFSLQQRYYQPHAYEDNNFDSPCNKPPKPRTTRKMSLSARKCIDYIWERAVFEKTHSKECHEYRKKLGFSILRGYITNDGDFPHMAALGWKAAEGENQKNKWIFNCGGTIISPKFVVTAGHCTKSIRSERLSNQVPEIVRIGVTNLVPSSVNNPKDINIYKIIKHPDYKSPQKYFDIALIELQNEIIFGKNIQPACLWENFSTKNLGKMSVASGWGITEYKTPSDVLRAVELELIDHNLCTDFYKSRYDRNWPGLKNDQICAGILKGDYDTCQGDSGGPLQVEINLPVLKGKMYYLVGVTSFGFRCGRANSPGVYTRISNYTKWIENIVWQKKKSTVAFPGRKKQNNNYHKYII